MNLLPLTIEVQTSGADKAISDMDRVSASAKNMATSAKSIKTDMTSAFGPSLTNNDVFGPIVPGATAASAAVKKYGSDVITANTATKDFRDTLRVARPVLNELGASMGLIGPLAGAARAGITGLGAAILGTLIVALENAADAAAIVETRLNALGGSAGGAMLKNLTGAANDARVPLSSLAGAFEQLTFAQLKNERASGVVYGSFTDGSKKVADALATIALAAKAGGAVSSEVKTIADTFASSLAKNKGLTAGLFDDLVQKAPTVAEAIAKAFGSSSVADFAIRLGDTTIPMNKVIAQLAAYKRAQEEITSEKPATLAQAWDNLTTAIGKATTALSTKIGVSTWIESLSKWIDDAVTNGSKLTFWLDSVVTAFQKIAGINIGGANSQFLTIIANLGNVVTAAQAAYAALARLAGASASVPTGSSANGAIRGGEYGEYKPYGSNGSETGGAFGGMFDPNSEAGSSAFATGGAFQVSGTGGTDSQRVSFMATPGETVSVTPPSGTNQVSATGYAGGGDFTVPSTTAASGEQVGGNIDSMLTSSSQGLVTTIRKMSDELAGLGINEEGAKSTISGAGNNKLPDVIRLTGIQQSTATTQSADRIIAAIQAGDINITAAISAMSSSMSASSAAASAASGTSSGSSGGAVGMGPGWQDIRNNPNGGTTYGQSSGSPGKGGKDTTLGPGGNMALWNQIYGGDYTASGAIKGTNSQVSPPGTNLGSGSSGSYGTPAGPASSPTGSSNSIASPQNAFAVNTTPLGGGLYGPGGGYAMGGFGNIDTGGMGYVAPYSSPDIPMATGGEIEVPPGHPTDTFRPPIKAKTGETIKVTRGDGGSSGGSSGGQRPINVTVNISAKDVTSFDKSKTQIANTLRVAINDAVRHI